MFLYYITDRSHFDGDETARRVSLIERIHAAARAGVDLIQLRERDLSAHELESLARNAAQAVSGTAAKLLINHRVDVAIATGAAGVHLRSGPGEISVSEARAVFQRSGKQQSVFAVSCHTLDEVRTADRDGADFVVFGPVFAKKDLPGNGIAALREACTATKVSVLALGGVTLENAEECIRAGAAGVAGIRLFQMGDVAETVARLRRLSDRL